MVYFAKIDCAPIISLKDLIVRIHGVISIIPGTAGRKKKHLMDQMAGFKMAQCVKISFHNIKIK